MLLMSSLSIKLCLGILLTLLLVGGIFGYRLESSIASEKELSERITLAAATPKPPEPPDLLVLNSSDLLSDPIGDWEKKYLGPVWNNGFITSISMPSTATAEEVLQTFMGNSLGPKKYKILETRYYGPESVFANGTAILYEAERGSRTIFATFYEGSNSWWYRSYPSGP